ncbi:MAG: helix-turn-helix transcriptional regulator, partial [Thermodesulfobacteriota bacterium]
SMAPIGLLYYYIMETKKIRTSRDIGEIIKKRRKELGISQEKLAEILGVTYQQIQRYENGTNRLNVENIQFVARALSVSVSYFFEPDKILITPKEIFSNLPAEDLNLIKYFQKIKSNQNKKIVFQVAQIASRV